MADVIAGGADPTARHDAPVVVAEPTSLVEAQLIAGLLSSTGIQAEVLTDDAGGADPQSRSSGVRVITAAADAAEARAVIEDVGE